MAKKALPDISGIENKINVGLYGGKSFFKGVRDTKYRAEVISCDCANCSFRDKGACLKVTSIAPHYCKYGQKHIYEGYTPQAMACREWCHVFKSDETYGKLKSVSTENYFGVIGKYYFINTRFVGVDWNEDGTYKFSTSTSVNSHIFLKKEETNADFLADLLTYKPYALFGGIIKNYQEDVVPMMLRQMQMLAPELFEALTEAYPEFAEKTPSFVGKVVYVKTLKGGIDIYFHGHGTFHLSEDKSILTCKDYSSCLLPFGAKVAELTINVTDDMTYKVQSDSEVCEDTVIAD